MDKIKKSFLQRMKISIFNVEKYQDLALEKTSGAIKYFVKLVLLFAIIISIAAVYKFGTMTGFFVGAFVNDFPEFTFSNNTLVADEVINTVRKDNTYELSMIVDTTIEADDPLVNEYITEISKTENGVIFLKDKVILGLEGVSGQATYKYAELNPTGEGEFTKQTIVDTLANTNVIAIYTAFFISMLIYMFILYLISTALETIFIAIIGFITAKVVKVNIKASQILSMAISAITLSVLLNAIYTPIKLITGFNMEYFSIMYTFIPYIYIITAILMIRSELIKQQIEIQKIEKVQKEVKKELEEEKEREKEKQEEKNKKEDEEKGGEQPEGSNA